MAPRKKTDARVFSQAEAAVIGELFEFASVCAASPKPALQGMSVLVMERLRRIIECETGVLVYSPPMIAKVCKAVADVREQLTSKKVN